MRLVFTFEICYRVARCMTEEILKSNHDTSVDMHHFMV